ncbi:MAG: sulfatase-like hydrolase/transferase [bacterium]|nr:sulfatase-like hydrolase/transferase [bacterium]
MFTLSHILNKSSIVKILKSAIILYVVFFSVRYAGEMIVQYAQRSIFDLLAFISIWLFSCTALLLISMRKNTFLKVFAVLFLGFFSLLLDLHYVILEDALNFESLMHVWSERSFFMDAYDMYRHLAIMPLVRFLLFLTASFLPVENTELPKWNRKIPATVLLSILLMFNFTSRIDGDGIKGIPSQLSFVPFFISLAHTYLTYTVSPREEVTIPLNGSTQIDKIILIVDESVAGDFIDLTVNRGTTPYMLSIQDRIVNFGLALSSYNSSSQSNAILRMGIGLDEFMGPNGKNLFSNPFIWQYAHTAGYETTFMDVQVTKIKKYQNYMDNLEAEHIDNINMEIEDDHEAALILRDIIKKPGKQFVYLVKEGAHFHYEIRYPENQKIFTPTLEKGELPMDMQRVVNSYKNVVKWSVDEFYKILLSDISLKNTLIIYTSDHGQDFANSNGTAVFYGRNRNAKPPEVLVPMMVITDNKEIKQSFKKAISYNIHRTMHFQIFPTILFMMGYNQKVVREKYTATLFDRIPEIVGFFQGNLKYGKRSVVPVDQDLTKYIYKQK